jgi:hypothetical protein
MDADDLSLLIFQTPHVFHLPHPVSSYKSVRLKAPFGEIRQHRLDSVGKWTWP